VSLRTASHCGQEVFFSEHYKITDLYKHETKDGIGSFITHVGFCPFCKTQLIATEPFDTQGRSSGELYFIKKKRRKAIMLGRIAAAEPTISQFRCDLVKGSAHDGTGRLVTRRVE